MFLSLRDSLLEPDLTFRAVVGRRPWLMQLARNSLGTLGVGHTASREKIGRPV